MGTYTTNYNLFMPNIGEQGWGELVNRNFTTIDATMKELSNNIGTLSNNIGTLSNNIGTLGTEIDAVEERVTVLENRVTIDANGNIVGDLIGNASTATQLNKIVNVTPSTVTVNNLTYLFTYCPYVPGVLYSGSIKVKCDKYSATAYILSSDNTWTSMAVGSTSSATTHTFSNAKCVVITTVYHMSESGTTIYLPIFS